MTEPTAREVLVYGRVQGVFFRAATRRVAEAAGVRGWIRNEPDGTVRAHLEGTAEQVAQVVGFMRHGPERALVDGVEVHESAVRGLTRFEVR